MKIRSGMTAMAVLALAACSSGNDTLNSGASADGSLQGAYTGTTANGVAFDTLFLDGGRFYVIYGNRDGIDGPLLVNGFIEGNGTSSNGSFTSTNVKDFSDNTNTPATVSISYGTGTGITGNLTINTATPVSDSFSAVPVTSGYAYGTAAKLSDITGSWQLTAVSGETVSVTVATTGNLTANSSGCSITGTVKPRASGRNVFDVSLTFGPAPCAQPNETATGSAISYLLPDGRRQLVMVGTNTARTAGSALFGIRAAQ